MARLKCKNCNQFFNLNGMDDIDCPNCGEKLTNSFTEWRKKKGNENKSFENYKHKKCYPSVPNGNSSTEYPSKHSHISKSHDPYKKIYQNQKSKKKSQRRIYLLIGLSFFILVTMFTNPQLETHREAFHQKLKEGSQHSTVYLLSNEVEDSSWKEESFDSRLVREVTVTDFILFSITQFTWAGRIYPVGFGFLGHVYISDYVNHVRKTGANMFFK